MPPLGIEDFRNPLFDKQRIAKRQIHVNGRKVWAYEGTTFTDNFVEVGFTYILSNGELSIVNTNNEKLFLGKIHSAEEFEKALKKADKKNDQLEEKRAKTT